MGLRKEGSGGVGHGCLFQTRAGHRQVDLGGGQVAVAKKALKLGEGGTVVHQEGGVSVAQGVSA